MQPQYYIRAFTFLPLLFFGFVVASGKENSAVNETVVEPFHWAAFGNSFAAGPGAGKPTNVRPPGDNRTCRSGLNNYPYQLHRDPPKKMGSKPLNGSDLFYAACTGDITTDVIKHQLPAFHDRPKVDTVTLSIGGNDLGFSQILQKCVLVNLWGCDSALKKATDQIKNGTFEKKLNAVYDEIEKKFKTKKFQVYQTGYDQFFNANDPWCNDKTMRMLPWPLPAGKKLTVEKRRTLNSLAVTVNSAIVAALAKRQPANTWYFVETDSKFDKHRFCEPGVQDPKFQDPRIWFFMKNANDTDKVGFEYFSDVDPKTCMNKQDYIDDRLEAVYKCHIAMWYDKASHEDDEPETFWIPEGWYKVFHPKSAGFTAIKNGLKTRIENYPKLAEEFNLTIMTLGDEITSGYGSTGDSGYQLPLLDILGANQSNSSQVVEFVGSQQSGEGEKNHHEGYENATISEIATKAADSIKKAQPDVVLLHAGTRDMYKSRDPATAARELGELIDLVLKSSPGTTVLAAEIIPSKKADMMDRVWDYNTEVALEVSSRRAAGSHVWLIHMPLLNEWFSDEIHPNDEGYKAMASRWADGVGKAFELGWI